MSSSGENSIMGELPSAWDDLVDGRMLQEPRDCVVYLEKTGLVVCDSPLIHTFNPSW